MIGKLAVGGLAILLLGSPLKAESVGDKMPKMHGRSLTGSLNGNDSVIHQSPYTDKKGQVIDPKNFEYAFALSLNLNCKQMVPFAVLSYEKNEIYVDSDFDGEIDYFYDTAGSSEIGEYMISVMIPKCSVIKKIKI